MVLKQSNWVGYLSPKEWTPSQNPMSPHHHNPGIAFPDQETQPAHLLGYGTSAFEALDQPRSDRGSKQWVFRFHLILGVYMYIYIYKYCRFKFLHKTYTEHLHRTFTYIQVSLENRMVGCGNVSWHHCIVKALGGFPGLG